MSIFKDLRTLRTSAETLSAVALDNADTIPVTADSVRMASRQVAEAATSVRDLADLVKGLVAAVAIGWTVGTLIGAIVKVVDAADPSAKWQKGLADLGLAKQTLDRRP